MNIKSEEFKIKRAEWVCLIFLGFAAIRIAVSLLPLDWSNVRWNTFPRLDILFIALTVWILKLTRQHRFWGISILLLLVLCFYGYSGNREEPFLPIRHYLGPALMLALEEGRFVLLALIVFAISFLGYKNTATLKDAFSKIRMIIPFFLIVYLYPFVPLIIHSGHASGVQDYDMALAKIDWTLFFGHNPNLLLESWIRPMLSEWMAFAYSSYGPLFAVVFGSLYLKKENNPAEEMIFMSTLALAIGYASYTFFPARGPMYAQKFTIPLDLYYMKEFKDLFMDQPRIDRDCFPSLHTAVTMISLFSAWKYIRPLFWLILPIAIFVPIACVYLRYHYVVDVLAGFVLAIMVIGLTKFVQKKKESRL